MHRYTDLLSTIDGISLEELLTALRRKSHGFARGTSLYRGVTQNPAGATAMLWSGYASAVVVRVGLGSQLEPLKHISYVKMKTLAKELRPSGLLTITQG